MSFSSNGTPQIGGHWVIGITGASGVVYGVTLIKELLQRGRFVHIIITEAGWRVLQDELAWDISHRQQTLDEQFGPCANRYEYHKLQNIGASIASGSYLVEGMVILPCSMGTLSSIAQGSSSNLLERAADVMIKEGRKLLIVPRETPLHAIHLENMLRLSRMGCRIIPAMPAFYQMPKTIDDIVRFLVGKVMDSMQIEHQLFTRWSGHHE
jgi:4-hydroxy-3-polyprenylbenzoate decarboxylase